MRTSPRALALFLAANVSNVLDYYLLRSTPPHLCMVEKLPDLLRFYLKPLFFRNEPTSRFAIMINQCRELGPVYAELVHGAFFECRLEIYSTHLGKRRSKNREELKVRGNQATLYGSLFPSSEHDPLPSTTHTSGGSSLNSYKSPPQPLAYS